MLITIAYTEEELQKLPLQIHLIGKDHVQEPVFRPNGIKPWQFFYCVRGIGEVTIGQRHCIILPNQGFLIPPNMASTYHAVEQEEWVLHIIGFSGESAASIVSTLKITDYSLYHFHNPKFFPDYIDLFLQIFHDGASGRTMKHELSKACYGFLLDVSRSISHVSAMSSVNENELVTRTIDYLERHYKEDVSLDELSSAMGRTKEYLCNIFKREMNSTIINHLTQIRIVHARMELVSFPDKSVAEIAADCGFQSASYFGVKFRNECGCTPGEYRAKMLSQASF